MIKTDYKSSERVTIIAPGNFTGYSGEVLENEIGGKRIPLKVKLDDNLGNWFFSHDEVQPTVGKQSNTATNKPTETIKSESTGIVSSENKKAVKQAKNKSKEIKITKRGPYRPRQPKIKVD